MKRELEIGRCGLACCLCSENTVCGGCESGQCPDKEQCENLHCSQQKGLEGCYACKEDCRKGLLSKSKPYGFTLFVRKYGKEALLDCLERNENRGLVYHRDGLVGDYDNWEDPEKLEELLLKGCVEQS